MKKFDVLVLGGGIIGVSTAYELAKSGFRVGLLDKRSLGKGASGASAAMLERQLDSFKGDDFISLADYSLRLLPSLHKEIIDITGIDFHLETCGILEIAATKEEAAFLNDKIHSHRRRGWPASWKKPAELLKEIPGLRPDFYGGAFYAGDGQVHGTRFLLAMLTGARAKGVEIRDNLGEWEWLGDQKNITGIRCKDDSYAGDRIVLAAGAWTDQLLAPLHSELGIEPVRGQMVVLSAPETSLPYPIYTPDKGYLVPKRDGTLLVGATVERVGFDESTTESARDELLALAVDLWPPLRNAKRITTTVGLRPKSTNELPFIGDLPGYPNIMVAAGHYRNGILLSAGTAAAVAALLSGQSVPLDLTPFSPRRVLVDAA